MGGAQGGGPYTWVPSEMEGGVTGVGELDAWVLSEMGVVPVAWVPSLMGGGGPGCLGPL